MVLYTSIIHMYGKYSLINIMEYKGANTPFTTNFQTACMYNSHHSTLVFFFCFCFRPGGRGRGWVSTIVSWPLQKSILLKKSIYFACSHDRKSIARGRCIDFYIINQIQHYFIFTMCFFEPLQLLFPLHLCKTSKFISRCIYTSDQCKNLVYINIRKLQHFTS